MPCLNQQAAPTMLHVFRLKAPPNGNGNNPEWYLPLSNFTAQYNGGWLFVS